MTTMIAFRAAGFFSLFVAFPVLLLVGKPVLAVIAAIGAWVLIEGEG